MNNGLFVEAGICHQMVQQNIELIRFCRSGESHKPESSFSDPSNS